MVNQILTISLILVALYLVLQNAQGFGTATNSVGSLFQGSIKTFQGR